MYNKTIQKIKPLGFTWETSDPFLFCVHHADAFPPGNDQLGPQASLAGRNLGQDFTPKDGWRMYHGQTVPGFPAHPHRGFETVTVVLEGFVDHSDSHGASGRYGNGDVQWMTAGSGLQHAEMFPLVNSERPNPLELFQIWLNLPKAQKMAPPFYKMLWAEQMAKAQIADPAGKITQVTLVAGALDGVRALPPAPDSWAAEPDNEVAIWIIDMPAGAQWTPPVASHVVARTLYYFEGAGLQAGGVEIPAYHAVELDATQPITLQTGAQAARLLLLQGRPIAEPVAQYGPFVMNSQQEIYQAFEDYRRTQFGGWPWQRSDPVHGRQERRFAKYADGTQETPEDL